MNSSGRKVAMTFHRLARLSVDEVTRRYCLFYAKVKRFDQDALPGSLRLARNSARPQSGAGDFARLCSVPVGLIWGRHGPRHAAARAEEFHRRLPRSEILLD
jgi:hypothetical protein